MKRLIPLVAAALVAAAAVLLLTRGSAPSRRHATSPPAAPPQPPRLHCTKVLSREAGVAKAIASAHGGAVICLSTGTYPRIDVSDADPTSYVTIQPAPGATAIVNGVQTTRDTFLRFQGLRMTAGVNMIGPGAASHDLQFIDNDIGHTTYGLVINGTGGPIRNVLIKHNSIHDLDFSGPSAGYAGGQGVTVFWGSDITVSYNTLWANSWHYIQCSSCDNMVVTHNLFTGPSNMHPGAHLNVWQIWQGSSNDSFTNNDVIGAPGAPIAAGAILWETGPGGGTLADRYQHMTVSNNRFVNEDSTTTLDLAAATGLTVTENTIVGSTYGLLIRGRCTCSPGVNIPGTNYDISRNIVVRDADVGARFRVFCPTSGSCGDNNVSDDDSARAAFPGATHYVTGWTPRWVTTAWDSAGGGAVPAGFYEPVGLSFPTADRAS